MAEEAKARGKATCSLHGSEKEQVWNQSCSAFQALDSFILPRLCLPPT